MVFAVQWRYRASTSSSQPQTRFSTNAIRVDGNPIIYSSDAHPPTYSHSRSMSLEFLPPFYPIVGKFFYYLQFLFYSTFHRLILQRSIARK